jgi:hypothetical protein
MNRNLLILIVVAAAVTIALAVTYVSMNKEGEDSDKYNLEGDWNLVSDYVGGWMDGVPIYGEDTTKKQKVSISRYDGDFYTFDTGDKKLYCSWDGRKMITSGIEDDSSVAFILLVPGSKVFMMVIHFVGDEGVIKLYQRDGYVGEFPGLSIPVDVPKVGETMESFKVREYTPDGAVDYYKSTVEIKNIEGRMLFYTVSNEDGSRYETVCIYLSARIFMSMGVSETDVIYDMAEYRGGVLYCSTINQKTGNSWVAEYGDESSADYPDKNISGYKYTGSEDYVIFKDGKIVKQRSDNNMGLNILMQDDECLRITTVDESGSEVANWTCAMTDLRPIYHYGMSVQSLVEFDHKQYYGWYFGYFDSKNCEELNIYGALTGSDGSCVVITQHYKLVR